MSSEEVEYRYNPNRGKVHKVVRRGETLLSDERCNLDDAEDKAVTVSEALAFVNANPDGRCEHCFGGEEPR